MFQSKQRTTHVCPPAQPGRLPCPLPVLVPASCVAAALSCPFLAFQPPAGLCPEPASPRGLPDATVCALLAPRVAGTGWGQGPAAVAQRVGAAVGLVLLQGSRRAVPTLSEIALLLLGSLQRQCERPSSRFRPPLPSRCPCSASGRCHTLSACLTTRFSLRRPAGSVFSGAGFPEPSSPCPSSARHG